MATTTSKGHIARQSHRFVPARDIETTSPTMPSDSAFEFDESDVYSSGRANSPEFSKSVHASRLANKSSSSSKRAGAVGGVGTPASLPVNVPDWSKILGDEYRQNLMRDSIDVDVDVDDDDDDEVESEGGGRVPPHEFLARSRIASSSVHEGVGRTLKGRDLSRVRNAIWAKTGFQD